MWFAFKNKGGALWNKMEAEKGPVAQLWLHFKRMSDNAAEQNLYCRPLDLESPPSNQNKQAGLPTNELVCMLNLQDAATLDRVLGDLDPQRVLWSEVTNRRRLALYTLLLWCQGISLIAVGHVCIVHICGYLDECYIYLSPGIYWMLLLGFLVAIVRFAESSYFLKHVSAVENGVAFMFKRKSRGASFLLVNSLHCKQYQYGTPACPITLLHCRWKQMDACKAGSQAGSSFIKLAVFSVPKETGLHVPVACDVIDTLRAGFRSSGMGYMNYHGVFVASTHGMAGDEQQRLMTFLFKSGFSILCNDASARLMVGMKRMGGFGQWKLHTVENGQHGFLSICIHFIPASSSASYSQHRQ